MKPTISVLLNTGRSGHSMIGLPDQHHFNYTLQALQRQSRQDFELIISDYIKEHRKYDWSKKNNLNFPVYHVPVDCLEKQMGYSAISHTKNTGITYAEGQYLVFLDDCCIFESGYLDKIIRIWREKKTFPNPLHTKNLGDNHHIGADGKQIVDCRFQILDQRGVDEVVDDIHIYGYQTCSLQAALRINGFDCMLDLGSRNLEDTSYGERLKLAGFHVSIHRTLIVVEQEHLKIGAYPDNEKSPWCEGEEKDPIKYKENIKCNGPFYQLSMERSGEDRIRANRRGLNDEERKKVDPCYLLHDGICALSGVGCNWLNPDGSSNHMKHPDAQVFLDNPPVFDLPRLRQERLAIKQNYKVK